jgi:hypothetical protein
VEVEVDYPASKARQGKARQGKARQGDIVLRRPWQRTVFIAGLVAGIALIVLAG